MAAQQSLISESISYGWQKVTSRFGFFASLIVITFAVSIFLSIATKAVAPDSTGPAYALAQLISNIISSALQFGVTAIALKVVADEETDLNDVLLATTDFKRFLNYIVVSIVYFFIVILGTIALIVPGIYFACKYWAAPYIVIDKNANYMQALHESGEITKGHFLEVIGLGIALTLINILGALAVGLGLLITLPLTVIATTKYYKKLSAAPMPTVA